MKDIIRRLRHALTRLIREPGIEVICQCGQSIVLLDAKTCDDMTFENISYECGCKTSFTFSLFYKKPERELIYVDYFEANRLLKMDAGWQLAPEEDKNHSPFHVYLERFYKKPAPESPKTITTTSGHGFTAGNRITFDARTKPRWWQFLKRWEYSRLPPIQSFVVTDVTEITMTIGGKCDGNHAEPPCFDAECWLR